MAQLTPRDDVRKAAGEILRRVDQLIKAGEIDHSIREIIRAKEIDPANVYIHAYEERLAYLKEEHEKNAEQEKTRKEAERAARERDEELRRRGEEEQKRQSEEQKHMEDDHRRQEEVANVDRTLPRHEEGLRLEPGKQEDNPQESVYIKAFKKTWSVGNHTAQQAIALELLGKELGISPERQLQLETRLHEEIHEPLGPSSILVIDDDAEMLLVIARMLKNHGFDVTALTTSDEGYTLVKKWKPGLILCDVNLETSTMGGFSFYEKIRKLDHLREVPFIFLTGLSDEILIRTGKEMGVDDYLTKPISEQNLVATIKGKLKRFSHLREKS
jgi:CheY-like chemotaxis protein